MAKNRRSSRAAAPVAENSEFVEWERELLGLPPGTPTVKPKRRTKAEIRKWDQRAMRLSGRTAKAQANRKRTPKTSLKPKTAEAAEQARRMAENHRKGKFTRDFKPRKSRRALKRELHPQKCD